MTPGRLQAASVAALLGLIALGLAWELWLAPIRPGGSWLALKVVPLLFALRGLLHGRRYTFQWVTLLVWLYVAEGAVRAASDRDLGAALGALQAGLAVVLFAAAAAYARLTAPSRRPKPDGATPDP